MFNKLPLVGSDFCSILHYDFDKQTYHIPDEDLVLPVVCDELPVSEGRF
jgi:hypothetical protein